MKKQYIIRCNNIDERKCFYNYLIDSGYKPMDNFKHQDFINNRFPFVVEPNHTFWVCESIACCAAAVSCGAIITIQEYFYLIEKQKRESVSKVRKL